MALPDFSMFANRLAKMNRHFSKWARRQEITCFRFYDADLPEFPLVLEWFGPYLHVAEYKRNHPLSDEDYQQWWILCRETIEQTLQVPPENVFYKTRERQKGKNQYEKRAAAGKEVVVGEGGLKFIINLTDYLDTGLFLDHRITRGMVRDAAPGKDVLNLFAYTGSFSVYAAAGHARSTTTVDLSNTYLQWARRNFEINGLTGPHHLFFKADIMAWLQEADETRYDLVVLDPPTFSNSKMMKNVLDVQRDHPWMIRQLIKRLRPGGEIYFSTNFKKFTLELDPDPNLEIKNITGSTLPPDFRQSRIHNCFKIKKIL